MPYIHMYLVYCLYVCRTVTLTHLPSPPPTQLIFPMICNLFCFLMTLVYILVYILCMILNFLWYDSDVRREHLLMSVCHHCSIYSEALLSHHIECCTIIAICSLFTNLLSEYLQILSLFLVRLCYCFYCLERKRIAW